MPMAWAKSFEEDVGCRKITEAIRRSSKQHICRNLLKPPNMFWRHLFRAACVKRLIELCLTLLAVIP